MHNIMTSMACKEGCPLTQDGRLLAKLYDSAHAQKARPKVDAQVLHGCAEVVVGYCASRHLWRCHYLLRGHANIVGLIRPCSGASAGAAEKNLYMGRDSIIIIGRISGPCSVDKLLIVSARWCKKRLFWYGCLR